MNQEKAELKTAAGDKNHPKICTDGAAGGHFHPSLHNRGTRIIFHFSLSGQSISERARGFGRAGGSRAQPALGALRWYTSAFNALDVLARGPFIKMASEHLRAADLNFNLFC